MRIGITCYSTYGGSGVLATELGKALAEAGHVVHFITRTLPYRLTNHYHENIFFHQVEMYDYPVFGENPYALALASKMAEIAKREKLDVLHVHYAIPHATSAFLAQQMLAPTPLPIITTLHGTDITLVGSDPSYIDITRFSINRSTRVTAVSEYLKNETLKIFKPEIEIQRIYNFVDTDLFQHKISKHCHGVKTSEVVFLHMSNFRKVKRVLDVVRTFHVVHQAEPETCLLMVGEGPLLIEARNLVVELELEGSVHFLGKQEDIVSVLTSADILLFPSEVESFGLVALEAMAAEIPVIASRSGGIPEVVVHGECGFMADVGDTQKMGEYGIELVRNCELRKKMGKAGRKRALENFTIQRIIPQYVDLYQGAIDSLRS